MSGVLCFLLEGSNAERERAETVAPAFRRRADRDVLLDAKIATEGDHTASKDAVLVELAVNVVLEFVQIAYTEHVVGCDNAVASATTMDKDFVAERQARLGIGVGEGN